jgi:hypothetical protein
LDGEAGGDEDQSAVEHRAAAAKAGNAAPANASGVGSSDDEEEEDEDEDEPLTWAFLAKQCGWKARSGGALKDWVYLRPGQAAFGGHADSSAPPYYFTQPDALAFAAAWGVVSRGGVPAPRAKGHAVTIREAPFV